MLKIQYLSIFFFFFILSKYYACLLRTAPVSREKNIIKPFCKSKRRFSGKSRGKMQKANGRGKHRGKFNPLNRTSFLGFICTRPLVKQLYFYIKIFFRQNKLHIINMDSCISSMSHPTSLVKPLLGKFSTFLVVSSSFSPFFRGSTSLSFLLRRHLNHESRRLLHLQVRCTFYFTIYLWILRHAGICSVKATVMQTL